MIKTLYDTFQHWSDGGSVYLISDTHFGDEDRPFMGYDISEDEQINILKRRIHRNDTLIHLGDVGDPSYIAELSCYKVLILGNHDQSVERFRKTIETVDLDDIVDIQALDESGYRRKIMRENGLTDISLEFHRPFVRGYKDNELFDEVYQGPVWISEKLVLSHEPVNVTACITGKPVAINIHGHDHSGKVYSPYHVNITQNAFGYEPLDLKKFINSGILKSVKSVHREIIDNARA